jgi:hypothetical protein
VRDEYGRSLGQNGGVNNNVEVIDVYQVLNHDLPVISQLLVLFLTLTTLLSGGFPQELLSSESLLFEADKELVLEYDCVVHVAIVIKVQVVIEDLFNFVAEKA